MGSPSVSAPLPLAFHIATVRHHVRNQARSILRRGRYIKFHPAGPCCLSTSVASCRGRELGSATQHIRARPRTTTAASGPSLRRLPYAGLSQTRSEWGRTVFARRQRIHYGSIAIAVASRSSPGRLTGNQHHTRSRKPCAGDSHGNGPSRHVKKPTDKSHPEHAT